MIEHLRRKLYKNLVQNKVHSLIEFDTMCLHLVAKVSDGANVSRIMLTVISPPT